MYGIFQPASFRGVPFHVEAAGRSGGRRQAVFEFPKKDIPYAEDMGRRARRFPLSAYLLGDDFAERRDELIAALEEEGPGLLVHHYYGSFRVSVETYSVVERRDRGRMSEIEIFFVEAGRKPGLSVSADTQAQARSAAGTARESAKSAASKSSAGPDWGTWT